MRQPRHRNSIKIRDELVVANMRLVDFVLKNLRITGPGEEDARSIGMIGLIKAAELFDPSRGFRFSTYAVRSIRLRILREVDSIHGLIHIPKHAAVAAIRRQRGKPLTAGQSRFADLADDAKRRKNLGADLVFQFNATSTDVQAAEDEDEARHRRERVAKFLAKLTPVERLVITKRFGLDGEPPMTLSEVGLVIGRHKERARQIERDALLAMVNGQEQFQWSA